MYSQYGPNMATTGRQQGFNLIELMVVLVLTGIVMSVGIPQFNSTIARGNISAESNRFTASINFARSQAVNKQQTVTLARKSTTANDWTEGWTIYSDAGGEGNQAMNVGDGDVLLKDISTDTAGLSIRANAEGDQWISFDPSGRLAEDDAVAVAVCNDDLTDGLEGSRLEINIVGRTKRLTIAAADKADQCLP